MAVASIFVDVAVNEFEGILTWQNASVALTEALKLARFPFQPSVVSLVGSQARFWAIALIMTAERAASYVAVQTLIFTTYAHAHRKVGILLLQPSVHSIAKQARVAIHQLAEMSLVHVCRSTFQQWTQHVATISFSDAVRAAQQNVEFIFEPSTVHDVGAAAQKYAADLPQHVVLAVEKYAIFVAQHAAVEELCSTAREYATVFGKFKLSEWLPYFFVFSTCGKVIILSL